MNVARFLTVVSCLVAALVVEAGVGWKNIDAGSHVGGRKASAGYLQGKVVMVYKGLDQMPRMEAIWQSFKSKQFVLLGVSGENSASCSFPQYRGAGLAENEPGEQIYVVNGIGRVAYRGFDERLATESVVSALTDLASPRTLDQWRSFLEFELENLPAHAYLRFAAFKKKYPAAAADYDDRIKELRAVKNVDKIAKLVAYARQSKDMNGFDPKKRYQQAKFVQSVKAALPKARALLKDCDDERLAQEAKNAIADLQWTVAIL